MSKRLLSALVAFCVALTLMPSWALAGDVDGGAEQDPPKTAASTGAQDGGAEDETGQDAASKEKTPGQEAPAGSALPGDGTPAGDGPDSEDGEDTVPPAISPADPEDEGDGDLPLEPVLIDLSENVLLDADDEPLSSDDLLMAALSGYHGEEGVSAMSGDLGTTDILTAREKQYYNLIMQMVRRVAASGGTARVDASSLNMTQAEVNTILGKVVTCVTFDSPELLYWWGRRIGVYTDNRVNYIYLTANVSYCAGSTTLINGEDVYLNVNSTKASQANSAIQAVNSILAKYADASDYEKLVGYKNEICALVEYNDDALAPDYETNISADPWQIVSVFDEYVEGGPQKESHDTNVVCEGYAKAFQHLCNLTDFEDSSIKCYTVTGWMGDTVSDSPSDGNGPHMWNIVRVKGNSYLVDVTNCDAGSVGAPDKLFMVGAAGSITGKYTVTMEGGGTQEYHYDYTYQGSSHTEVTALYGTGDDSVLKLASEKYVPPRELRGSVEISGTPTVGQTLTAVPHITSDGPGTLTYTWNVGGATSTGETYVIRAADAGKTITVTVTAANYPGGELTSDAVTVGQLRTPAAADFNSFTAPALTYDGTSVKSTIEALVVSTAHAGHFTVSFMNARGTAVAEPTDAGTYTVYASVAAHDAYAAAANIRIGTFTIAKAQPSITITSGTQLTLRGTLSLTAAVDPAEAGPVTWSLGRSDTRYATLTGSTLTGVRVGSVTVTASTAATNNYLAASASASVSVVDKTPQVLSFAGGNSVEKTYQDGTFTVPVTVEVGPGPATLTYASSDSEVAAVAADGTVTVGRVGTAVITVTSQGDATYADGSAEYTVTVKPKTATPTLELDYTTHVYDDGNELRPGVTVKVGDETLAEDTYQVEYAGNTDAGTASVSVTALDGCNYTWAPAVTASFTITKAPAPAVDAARLTIQQHYQYDGVRSFEVSSLFSSPYEPTGYTLGTVVNSAQVLAGNPEVNGTTGALTYTLTGTANENDTATAEISVTFKNHETAAYTLTVRLVSLPVPAAPAAPALSLAQKDATHYTATASAAADPAFAASGLEYNFYVGEAPQGWQDGNTFDVEAGASVKVLVRTKALTDVNVEGADASTAELITPPAFSPRGGSFTGTQTVELKAPGAPGGTIVYTTDGSAPTYSEDEEGGFNGNGSVYVDGTPISITATTTIKAIVHTAGGSDSEAGSAAFTRRTGTGGGGGSPSVIGGSGKPASTPGASTTPSTPSTPGVSNDHNTTIAAPNATVKDGAASVTVNGASGKDLVDQAVSNDSDTIVVAPSIPSAAGRTNVTIGSSVAGDISSRTDADLRVETPAASVTIPNRGLSGLAGRGGSLVVSTSASGGTIDVSITAGGSRVDRVTGGVRVDIPADCTPGTVAVISKADGSTELVRKSVADAAGGTVTVPLEGSATITLMDNSQSFRDVPAGNTFANAVAFVSSREIMNGTGGGMFNPGAPLTRAQLAKILHNLESNPAAAASARFSDVAGDAWCAEAVQWAASQGIVTGYADGTFQPNSYITREQLAVMLYRYAGSPPVRSASLNFSDASRVGGYAQAAMAWATQNGVINGESGNLLDPKGQATRAQAAQMLLNYISNIG